MKRFTMSGLTIEFDGTTYTCKELEQIPEIFAERFGGCVDDVIKGHIDVIREDCHLFVKRNPEATAEERRRLGLNMLEVEIARTAPGIDSPFGKLLFWLCNTWWFYNPVIVQNLYLDTSKIYRDKSRILKEFIMSALPDAITQQIRHMALRSVAASSGNFALLFEDERSRTRRIVTATQLIELRGVSGYTYLDMLEDGTPVARSRCEYLGKRAFFDGTRLMAHYNFCTCAPPTIPIRGGYKVNSTGVSLVNGQLFPMIDEDDKIAHRSTSEMDNDQGADTIQRARALANDLAVQGEDVLLRGEKITPIGMFLPSGKMLLDSGFVHYEWSRFVKL